jgi:hypothetical protein
LKVVKLVSDIWDLNQLISNVTKISNEQLLSEGRIWRYSDSSNPLYNLMDSI